MEIGTLGINATMQNNETDESYHDSPGISSSGMKLFAECPAHYWAEKICPDPDAEPEKEKEHFVIGKAFHCGVLEPHRFNDSFVAVPKGIGKRTKEEKKFWFDFQEKHKGKGILKHEDMHIVQKCSEAVRRLPIARLIESGKGIAECSIRWEVEVITPDGEVVKILRKCRPDYFIPPCALFPNGFIIDLKAVDDASPEGFRKAAFNHGYHIQSPWYQDGIMEFYGTKEPPPFVFVVAEKHYPWLVKTYRATERFVSLGRRIIQEQLPLFAQCISTNVWPGYGENTQDLDPPDWVLRKEKYREW